MAGHIEALSGCTHVRVSPVDHAEVVQPAVIMDRRTLGSSMRTGVVGAVVAVLPAYFLMFVDDGVPAVAGIGVLILTGWFVVAARSGPGLHWSPVGQRVDLGSGCS